MNIPALRHFVSRPSPEDIMKEAEAVFGDDRILVRQVSIYLCHKYSGVRLREIGERFNVRDTGISEASRRFVRKLETDGELRREVERIKGKFM